MLDSPEEVIKPIPAEQTILRCSLCVYTAVSMSRRSASNLLYRHLREGHSQEGNRLRAFRQARDRERKAARTMARKVRSIRDTLILVLAPLRRDLAAQLGELSPVGVNSPPEDQLLVDNDA